MKQVRAIQPEGPYCLAGWCLAGVLAFEIAQQLHAQGQKVSLLALLDSSRPGYLQSLPAHARLVMRANRWIEKIRFHGDNLKPLGTRAKLGYLRESIRSTKNNIENRVWRIACRLYLSTGRRLVKPQWHFDKSLRYAALHYHPRVYPGRITLFQPVTRPLRRWHDPLFGWGELAAGGVDLQQIPGDHNTMFEEPNVGVLAHRIKGCLKMVREESRLA